jgi:hypothetical protein
MSAETTYAVGRATHSTPIARDTENLSVRICAIFVGTGCLADGTALFPLIDFLVVDGEHVLLSFLSSESIRQGYQYIYVRSTAIAEHYTEYFDECWRVARVVHAGSASHIQTTQCTAA